jgi:toxin ParE1/3/4
LLVAFFAHRNSAYRCRQRHTDASKLPNKDNARVFRAFDFQQHQIFHYLWQKFSPTWQIFHFLWHPTGQDNPDAALSLVEMIRDKTEALRTRPKMYREGRMRGTREMVVHRNYIVFYRVSEHTVTIQRVKHARQQWP